MGNVLFMRYNFYKKFSFKKGYLIKILRNTPLSCDISLFLEYGRHIFVAKWIKK